MIPPMTALAGRAVAPKPNGRSPEPFHQCTDQPRASRTNSIVNLRRTIAAAVSHAPVKEVAREFGISPREVDCLRTETGFPRVPIFLEIARRDPNLRAQVMAILSGDGEAASPEAVDALVRKAGRP